VVTWWSCIVLVSVYHGSFLLLQILNDGFARWSILGLKLFSFSAQNTSHHAFLAFKVYIEKPAVILMGYLYMLLGFFLS
jgi:hypothetical protein